MTASSPQTDRALFEALAACLPDDSDATLLRAYAEPEPIPQPPRGRNLVYYHLERDDAPGDAFLALQPAVVRTKPAAPETPPAPDPAPAVLQRLAYRLVIVCYGPEAEANALRIRAGISLDGPGSPRQILRAAGLYPRPDPPQPLLLWEPAATLWRRRADLTVFLTGTLALPDPFCNPILTPPEIRIHR